MTAAEYKRLPLSTRLGNAADSASDREAEWEADALTLEKRLDRALALLRTNVHTSPTWMRDVRALLAEVDG